jgi:hypothetical protein
MLRGYFGWHASDGGQEAGATAVFTYGLLNGLDVRTMIPAARAMRCGGTR